MSTPPIRKTFAAGQQLLREGVPNDQAFLITEGEVEIRTGTFTSSPTVVARLDKGEVIGEMSLFDDQTPTATAQAVTQTSVIVLTRAEFQKRLAAMDPVMRGVLGVLIKRMRGLLARTLDHGEVEEEHWAKWKK